MAWINRTIGDIFQRLDEVYISPCELRDKVVEVAEEVFKERKNQAAAVAFVVGFFGVPLSIHVNKPELLELSLLVACIAYAYFFTTILKKVHG